MVTNIHQINYTLSLLRIIACLLIVWNHMSGFMLDSFLNPWDWANIGVQIFFFISGYLYGGKLIYNRKDWIIRQSKKILKPYYLSLIILIPLVCLLDWQSLNIINSFSALLCVQGFVWQIDGLGQHWFISYILVCYFVNVLILNRINFTKTGSAGFWLLLVSVTILLQIITLPLYMTFTLFKSAYIMTFVIGYSYKVRFVDCCNKVEKKYFDIILIVCAFIGFIIRYYLEDLEYEGMDKVFYNLTKQYIKLIWACAIFVSINKLLPNNSWARISLGVKNKLVAFAGITYEIYLVHEFFLHTPYLSILGEVELYVKIIFSIISIIVATYLLCLLEKIKLTSNKQIN